MFPFLVLYHNTLEKYIRYGTVVYGEYNYVCM